MALYGQENILLSEMRPLFEAYATHQVVVIYAGILPASSIPSMHLHQQFHRLVRV